MITPTPKEIKERMIIGQFHESKYVQSHKYIKSNNVLTKVKYHNLHISQVYKIDLTSDDIVTDEWGKCSYQRLYQNIWSHS